MHSFYYWLNEPRRKASDTFQWQGQCRKVARLCCCIQWIFCLASFPVINDIPLSESWGPPPHIYALICIGNAISVAIVVSNYLKMNMWCFTKIYLGMSLLKLTPTYIVLCIYHKTSQILLLILRISLLALLQHIAYRLWGPHFCLMDLYLETFWPYRAPLKGGPFLLSTTQAAPGRNFSQPRAHLLVEPCTSGHFCQWQVHCVCSNNTLDSWTSSSSINPSPTPLLPAVIASNAICARFFSDKEWRFSVCAVMCAAAIWRTGLHRQCRSERN